MFRKEGQTEGLLITVTTYESVDCSGGTAILYLIIYVYYGPVKFFCPNLPPGHHGGQKKNVCDKKGQSTGKKSDYSVYKGRGNAKIK